MSKTKARETKLTGISGYETSIPRCVLAGVLVVLGIAWLAVYAKVGYDPAHFQSGLGLKKPSDPIPAMSSLGDWNFLIGFGLFFLGLVVAANKFTPLGRGRGVVIGMLGSFVLGLIWVVVFYFAGPTNDLPLMGLLGQKNLFVGVAFMAVGFAFATKWE